MHTQLMIMASNFPNTNTSPTSLASYAGNKMSFKASSDFFEFNDWFEDDIYALSTFPSGNNLDRANYTPNEVFADPGSITNSSLFEGAVSNRNHGSGREEKEIREKVAFRTKSEIEVLNDGFKWRKYGKKMVKNSQNPRNYYKCSVEGCLVKKRVERDNEDRRYVITTYEGIHNHEGPTT